MTFPGKPRSSLWRPRMKFSIGFESLRPRWRTRQGRRSRSRGQILGVNIPPINSSISARRQRSRGSWQSHATLNRMGLRRERTGPSSVLPGLWYMTRICLCSFGQRHVTRQYMCRTEVLKGYWETRLLRKHSGVKPEIGHLRIFGCLVFIHVPMEKRTKLEPSRENGIFVGYSETSKSYKIFISTQRKKVVSKDVKFKKNLASRKSHELPPMAKDAEQEITKGEQCSEASSSEASSSGNQTSCWEEDLAPSNSIRRPRWFTQTLKGCSVACWDS